MPDSEPKAGPTSVWKRRWLLLCSVGLAGLLWRLMLMQRYAGWEESDYGNLAMIRGVLDSGFRHFDMNHMPGYYALGAAALALVGDTVVAAKGVSLVTGLVALVLSTWLADTLFGRKVAWLSGVLLVFQPEFALYSASALREPVYAACMLGMVACLSRERLLFASLCAGGAFLVRMDGALVVVLVLAVHALSRRGRARRLLGAWAPFLAIVGAWAVYTKLDHGTFAFWGHSVAVNVETGLGEEATSPLEWWRNGLTVSGTLGAWLLPWRIGWGIWAGWLLALLAVPWTKHSPRRTWLLTGGLMAGVWGGIGLVGQHSPEHNLYWKWLSPIVPMLVPAGVAGLLGLVAAIARRTHAWIAPGLMALLLAQALGSNLKETHRQVSLSARLYAPQLALGRWIEANIAPDQPVIVDNIPACWLNRHSNQRRLWSWFDVPADDGSEGVFAEFVQDESLGWVLWFKEDWTQAPVAAPFLAHGGTWEHAGVRLEERDREDEYGWIWYEVVQR